MRIDPAPRPMPRRIADLAAEARLLSADHTARTPERMAAYFWTKAAVLAEIANNWGDSDHPQALQARQTAADARRHALNITDALTFDGQAVHPGIAQPETTPCTTC
ncbi:hypothetical protein [Sphaerisporangium sp. NPDC051011]|uniref:hypothetical protein n=1 Tax=Sphaerisporangium sp. NPDC051011 TaxID=3155792 RepID=UPI0033D7A71E